MNPAFAKSFASAFVRLCKEEGIGSTFDGLSAMLSKQ